MVLAKNYETRSTFVEVMQKKTWPLFFPDTVYIRRNYGETCLMDFGHYGLGLGLVVR